MKKRIFGRLILDVILTGAALVVFALFHHVLPRRNTSLGIVIESRAEETESSPQTVSVKTGEAAAVVTQNDTGNAANEAAKTSARTSKRGDTQQASRRGQGRDVGASSGAKGGSALTEETTPVTEAVQVSMNEKFPEMYSDSVETGPMSYTSPGISIAVSERTAESGSVTYYIADIYLKDIHSFRTALAEDSYGTGFRDTIPGMAILNAALVAVNGDYYGNTNEGVVIRNGVIYRANPTDCDVCVLYQDGQMRVLPGAAFDVEEAIRDGAWQAWTFGPALLDGTGHAITSFASTGRIIAANPRTALGYFEPGHYCLVVVDGRGVSAGMTLQELSQLFEELGCSAAYNLDGGNSSVMVWQDAVINHPSGGGRASSDAVLIAEVT